MNRTVYAILIVLLFMGCKAASPQKKSALPPEAAALPAPVLQWQEVLKTSIPDPFEQQQDGSLLTLKINNAAPWPPERFEPFLIDLGKKLYNAQSPFNVIAVQAAGQNQTLLKATVYSVDLVSHLRGEISQAELLRRFQVEMVETLTSVQEKAKTARAAGRLADSQAALEKWLSLEPASVLVLSLLGNTYRDQQKYWEAISVYKKIRELDPNSVFASHNLGFTYDKLGAFEDSIAAYRKALEIQDNPQLRTQLAEVMRKNGYINGAMVFIAKLKTEQITSDVLMIEGNIHRDLKKYPQAREAYAQAQKINPADLRILFNLILVDLDNRSFTAAKQKFAELKSKDPLLADELKGIWLFQEEKAPDE